MIAAPTDKPVIAVVSWFVAHGHFTPVVVTVAPSLLAPVDLNALDWLQAGILLRIAHLDCFIPCRVART